MIEEIWREIEKLRRAIAQLQTIELPREMTVNKLTAVNDLKTRGDAAGVAHRIVSHFLVNYPMTDGFDAGSLAAAWSWADAPFITPNGGAFGSLFPRPSMLVVSHSIAGGYRSFLYRNNSPNLTVAQYCRVCMTTTTIGNSVGLRIDDGSDNNYAELKLRYSATNTLDIVLSKRTGGGAVTNTSNLTIGALPMMVTLLAYPVVTTQWTNWVWYGEMSIDAPGTLVCNNGALTGASWTPTRIGLIFDFSAGNSGWENMACDWWTM